MFDLLWTPSLGVEAAWWIARAAKLADMRDPLNKIRDYAGTILQRNIDSQGDGSWPELSEGTVDQRGSSGPMLIYTGELYSAVGDPGLWTVQADAVELSGVPTPPYAEYHLHGTEFMPERNFAYFMPQDTDAIEVILEDWLGTVFA